MKSSNAQKMANEEPVNYPPKLKLIQRVEDSSKTRIEKSSRQLKLTNQDNTPIELDVYVKYDRKRNRFPFRTLKFSLDKSDSNHSSGFTFEEFMVNISKKNSESTIHIHFIRGHLESIYVASYLKKEFIKFSNKQIYLMSVVEEGRRSYFQKLIAK